MSVLILVIDDDVRVRVTIQRLLEAANFHIITAPSGQAGLKLFRAHEPALVITDIIMPEREGIETIVQMRRERPATKIIAISGGGRIVDNRRPEFSGDRAPVWRGWHPRKTVRAGAVLAAVRSVLHEK
jgi:CheY-like chemotaxis protein